MKKILLISMLFVSVAKAQSLNDLKAKDISYDTAMVYLEHYVKKDGIVSQKISPCIIIYELIKRNTTLEMPSNNMPRRESAAFAVTGSYVEYMVVKILLDGKPFDLSRTHRIIENP